MRHLLLLTIMIVGCTKSTPEGNGMGDSKYKSLDVETLKTIPDDELEFAIVDYIAHKLQTGAGEEETL